MEVLKGTTTFIVHSAASEPVQEFDRAHVWFADLDAARQVDTPGRFVMSASERARADRLRSPLLRRRFVARCALVRHVLGKIAELSPEALEFETTVKDRPRLVLPARPAKDAPFASLDFNISHSENVLALAVAFDRLVGVDVEVVQPAADVMAVAEAQFASEELQWLRALPAEQQVRAFYRLWTRKEAMAKTSGRGIAEPPANASPLTALHSFQFRLGETDVIGALALDAETSRVDATSQPPRAEELTWQRPSPANRRARNGGDVQGENFHLEAA